MSGVVTGISRGITIYVTDIGRSVAWYSAVLGLEAGPSDGKYYAEMGSGSACWFHLIYAGPGFVPLSKPVFSFESGDIEGSRTLLADRGIAVNPIHWEADHATFEFRDPDVNALAVVQWFEMRVVVKEEIKLVGIRVRCPGDLYALEIPKAFLELERRLEEIPHRTVSEERIGVFKPGDYSDEEDGYWTCVQVERIGKLPEGMVSLTVPEQKYAIKWHYGPNTTIKDTYAELHRLLREAGHERDERAWHLEISKRPAAAGEGRMPVEIVLYETIR